MRVTHREARRTLSVMLAGDRGTSAGGGEPSARGVSPLASLDAHELVRLCLSNGPGAWEEFLRRYADLMYSTLHVQVGLRGGDRDDAFQNAILAIYTQLPRLRDPDRLVPWIIQISYRQGVNRIRARTRRRETSIDSVPDAALLEDWDAAGHDGPGEQERAALIRAQRAQEGLGLLPTRCQELLRLLFYQDPPLDYTEVARRRQIPVGSIGPTRARCLQKLRAIFERRGWVG